MSVDIRIVSNDQDENIKTRSFQPTLWLLLAVEVGDMAISPKVREKFSWGIWSATDLWA